MSLLGHFGIRNRTAVNTAERRRAVRQMIIESLEERRVMAGDVRSIDGTGNNLLHPEWGSAEIVFLRKAPAEYADGVSAPAGADRPSARAVSNALNDHVEGDVKNNRELSAMVYAWGQFLDHDIDLTNSATPRESFDIAIPTGDPLFDPDGTGTKTMSLARSNYDTTTGISTPRQQLNSITAFIDGSMIYGSDAETSASLRTMSGGMLKTSDGNLPPVDATGMFQAGDIRANENPELTSLHALFVREHNRVAAAQAAKHPDWTDEQLYQAARKVVIAEVQAITYNEFLPALLGTAAPREYRGYDPLVNPGIANEFATAAYRVGHTMLGDDIEFLSNDESEIRDAVALKDAFFNPALLKETGVDPILKYLATDRAEEIDLQLVDSVRNFLFGAPGSGGFDLAALNIQRGRDHGLADYNAARVKYGLPAVKSFADITTNVEVQNKLRELYGSVDNIDLWIGGLAEDHLPDSSVGPTFARIIGEQFDRLRTGDRFWYQKEFRGEELKNLEQTTLAQVIRRNTGITNLQANVFRYGSEIAGRIAADLNHDGQAQSIEPGIAGRVVQLVTASGDVVASTMTKPDGRYVFYGIENGNYRVRELPPSGETRPAAVSGELSITQRTALRQVTLAVPTRTETAPRPEKPLTPSPGNRPYQTPQNGSPMQSPKVDAPLIGAGQPTTNQPPAQQPSGTTRPPASNAPTRNAPATGITKPSSTVPAAPLSGTTALTQLPILFGSSGTPRSGTAPRLGMRLPGLSPMQGV